MKSVTNINFQNNDIQRNVYRSEERTEKIYHRNSGSDQNGVQPFWGYGNYNLPMDSRQSETQRPCKDSVTRTLQNSDKRAVSGLIWGLMTMALGIVAFIALFSEPLETSNSWFSDLLISKLIAIIAIIALKKAYHKTSEYYA